MTTREAFLAGVRREMAKATGLAPAEASARPPDPGAAATAIRARAARETAALLARFQAEAERVGASVHRAATVEAAGELVLALARAREVRRVATWGRRQLGAAGGVAACLAAGGLEVFEASPAGVAGAERASLAARLADAQMGLTGVDLAVAETGSLVLASGPGKGRGVSLLPGCHVAVFGAAQLVPGLAEAGVVLEAWSLGDPAGANIVFVTGPSRTADIELTLTLGVHGPREVHAVFVDAL